MERPDLALQVVVQQTYNLTQGLAYAAFRSELTTLYNRQALALLVNLHDSGVTPPFAVVYADLTGFKAINETFGHDGGDATLREFGRRFRMICEQVDGYAFHLSGDEFVALIPPERVDEFRAAARGIHSFKVTFSGRAIDARAHFGIAKPYEGGVINELQSRAEKTCSRAKTSQRQEPLVWTGEEQETQVIDRRWRCENCQATIKILVPAEKRGPLPFCCINCHEPLPEEVTPPSPALPDAHG